MKFYILESPTDIRTGAVTEFGYLAGSPKGDAPHCAACRRPIGMLPLVPPIRGELEGWGPRWGDIAFGSGDQILISEKMRTIFREAGLTGFVRLDPVEIVKIKRKRRAMDDPPIYHLASIQRSRAIIDASASGFVLEEGPVCPECRLGRGVRRAARIVIEPGTWSGEDVFIARGLPGTILVSERFKRLCEEADLANCVLIAAENYSFDFYPHDHTKPKVH